MDPATDSTPTPAPPRDGLDGRLLAMMLGLGLAVVLVLGGVLLALTSTTSEDDERRAELRRLQDPSRCPPAGSSDVWVRVVNGDPDDWCLYVDLGSGRVLNDPDEFIPAAPVEQQRPGSTPRGRHPAVRSGGTKVPGPPPRSGRGW